MNEKEASYEIKYRLGKYVFLMMLNEGLLNHEQYITLRDRLIDEYKPIIGELDRGADDEG